VIVLQWRLLRRLAYEQESNKIEIMNKALSMARWLISLRQQGYPYDQYADEETLAKKIFREEMNRLKEGLPSLFERKNVIPDKSLPFDESNSDDDLYND
jgi:hypothetical protein